MVSSVWSPWPRPSLRCSAVNQTPIAVLEDPTDPRSRQRSRQLAATLGLPLVAVEEGAGTDVLAYVGSRLEVRLAGARPFWVDFLGRAAERRSHGSRRSHPLPRAVGRKLPLPRILDATAGLGRDAYVLAVLGYEVLAVERCPILFALLENGWRRALEEGAMSEVIQRFRLEPGDARDVLLREESPPDVVYMDPMWPKRSKSGLAKKEMQFFQKLLGEEDDASSLFEVARSVARHRVVVKRPGKAPPLIPGPSYQVRGGRVRWDIYLVQGYLV